MGVLCDQVADLQKAVQGDHLAVDLEIDVLGAFAVDLELVHIVLDTLCHLVQGMAQFADLVLAGDVDLVAELAGGNDLDLGIDLDDGVDDALDDDKPQKGHDNDGKNDDSQVIFRQKAGKNKIQKRQDGDDGHEAECNDELRPEGSGCDG